VSTPFGARTTGTPGACSRTHASSTSETVATPSKWRTARASQDRNTTQSVSNAIRRAPRAVCSSRRKRSDSMLCIASTVAARRRGRIADRYGAMNECSTWMMSKSCSAVSWDTRRAIAVS
jgi:hypothetical protein